jgi:hypothetical protein
VSHHEVNRSREGRLINQRPQTKSQSRAEERPLGFVCFDPVEFSTRSVFIATNADTSESSCSHASVPSRMNRAKLGSPANSSGMTNHF